MNTATKLDINPYTLVVREHVEQPNSAIQSDSQAVVAAHGLSLPAPLSLKDNTTLAQAELIFKQTQSNTAFVVNNASNVVGLITKATISGRDAMSIASQRGISRAELTVDLLMIPVAKLYVVDREVLTTLTIQQLVSAMSLQSLDYLLVSEEGRLVGCIDFREVSRLTGQKVTPTHRPDSLLGIVENLMHQRSS
ncbi:hypothetical protein [Pleionea litopenaei]|uniref:CBS domain protein n=1 Tax=Pleionea litopenaei TaxID=3070815 RepID=A0AA51X5F5_9GAMM|nr:hypothetical protein [Pleionea sp. HL-JVS1]WMS85719.1 hypothetical protein Q9312_10885 [Pleionea sp. HL-JVS1]